MIRRSTPAADTRAAPAALERPSAPDGDVDRMLLVDDSAEDITQILVVLTERSAFARDG